MTTMADIRGWFERGVEDGATHMIVVVDTFDYEDYPVYVMPNQVCQVVHEEYSNKNMQRVMEIYDLAEDMDRQLKQHRSMSI